MKILHSHNENWLMEVVSGKVYWEASGLGQITPEKDALAAAKVDY